MMLVWCIIAILVAFFSIGLHSFVTYRMDPLDKKGSMARFRRFFLLRLLVLALFFWQIVQQPLPVLILAAMFFLVAYAGGLYYIIKRKPFWFQPELKKDSSVWMP